MRTKLCPKCGKPYPIGRRSCPRCRPPQATHGERTKEQEAARKEQNPWRAEYGKAAYKKARQRVCERQSGTCASCGKTCAVRGGSGAWWMRGGGVHHIRALSEGGGNDDANLVLLCTRCHNRIEAERRRA